MSDTIVPRLRYMARQYTNGSAARGGSPGKHYLDEAADELAAACYAGLGAECNLPESWLDALSAAANGEPFSAEGLLPFSAQESGELERLRAEVEAARSRWAALDWHWEDERDSGPGGRWWCAILCNEKTPSPEAAIDTARGAQEPARE